MEKEIEIYLDLSKNKLFGFQDGVDTLAVAIMCEGIIQGCEFPAVDVVRGTKGYKMLCEEWLELDNFGIENYGGHHRAVAHYIEGAKLRVRIYEGHFFKKRLWPFSLIDSPKIPINKISIVDDYYPKRARDALINLPRDVVERFCRENNLDINNYLSQ